MEKDLVVTDPRGRVIRCSVWYWENHVLVKHPDLKGYENFAESALQSPTDDCIYASHRQPSRHVYYGPFRGRLEIKVVVAFPAQDVEGKVVSVTAVSRRPDGEELIWHG
jgi:hypothetical protein